ncbi:heparinase II/III family protein [Kineococcus sp. DHX-1]|uniref:heparinase II/III domain-containing protein n=1 Tax=Kineococcus sp. DHX-1 TaxID=3349638 RepID=UPI0036D3CA10
MLPRSGSALPPGHVPASEVEAVLAAARADRDLPWPQTTASTWARVRRDGDRTGHEALVAALTHRTSRAALAALADPADPVLLDTVADAVLLRCEQSSWCWPAHDETLVPDPARPVLDLGAGEVAGQLAWTDHLLGGRLDERWPGLRARLRHEVRVRVLDPFRQRRDWHWLGLEGDVHNWNPWIHGNVLTAALALTDGAERAGLVALAVEGIDRYVAALPADGATDEGFDYWFNGACRAIEALDLVQDWTLEPRLRATTGFASALHLGGTWHASFADSRARAADDLPWHALNAAARAVGNVEAQAHAAFLAAEQERAGRPRVDVRVGLGRVVRELADDEWWAARDRAAAPVQPRRSVLSSLQVLVARSDSLSVGVKGGHDDEHHNHCDVGSVVVALRGVPVVVDPGRPTYTAATFGSGRYGIWTMGSAWHSVPQLGGVDQAPGRSSSAREFALRLEEDVDEVAMDLQDAYPGSGVRSWRRTVRLDRRRDEVLLSDRWSGADAGAASAVHLVLAGAVQLTTGRAVVEALDGAGALELCWDPSSVVGAGLDVRELDDDMLRGVWGDRLTRLRLELSAAPDGALDVTCRASAPGCGGSSTR